jgi:isoleucyl-tRNA synthetase
LVTALRSGAATVSVEGKDEVVTLDDVIITEVPREGWTVASENGESLALDLELNADLIAQGIARDITRMIQDARKASGFDISDRIHVTWNSTNADTTLALENYGATIAIEVLATEWVQSSTAAPQITDDELGVQIQIVQASRL